MLVWIYQDVTVERTKYFLCYSRNGNIVQELTERLLSPIDETNKHLQYEWQGYLSKLQSKAKYQRKRKVQDWDEEQQIYWEQVTNNYTWTASTLSELYTRR
jgi:hypothetical protein